MTENLKYQVICFGETLWDVFPDAELPGGAPMNVAVHLNQFKINTGIISRIGIDHWGEKLVRFLLKKNVSDELVQRDSQHPTGIVRVFVSEEESVTYEIVFPSAWDFIEVESQLEEKVSNARYLVFGSLAARHEVSRETLSKLLDVAEIKVFDVNLRLPHYNMETVLFLLSRSNIIKLNEDELTILGEWLGLLGNKYEDICAAMDEKFHPDMIIVTLGSKGAMVFSKGQTFKHDGYKVKVEDTVGSGDAFLAAFLSQQIKGESLPDSLEFSCAAGAFVASRQGANPDYTVEDILMLKVAGTSDEQYKNKNQ